MSKITLPRIAAACAVITLVAITSVSAATVAVGADEPTVVKAMGQPKARYALPGGAVRLAYPRGPAGKGTTMVDLGADGRVTSVREVLTEKALSALPAGMTEEELLREIGPPAERKKFGNKQTAWGYRFPTSMCLWYVLNIGPDGRLQGGGPEADPVCDPNRRK